MKKFVRILVLVVPLLVLLLVLIRKDEPRGRKYLIDSEEKPLLSTNGAADERGLLALGTLSSETSELAIEVAELKTLSDEANSVHKGTGVYRFAKAVEINKTANQLGRWKTRNGLATWTLPVRAEGALSLNFGFSEFELPPQASLTISTQQGDSVVTFTSEDNEEHGQLWTPLFQDEAVTLKLQLPVASLAGYKLKLHTVNYGFRNAVAKIGSAVSASCNVDVTCDTSDYAYAPLIDFYDQQIRSVGAYTIEGVDSCTGALINNTAGDRRPFFLTAEHCGITSSNAPSVVVHWNFQNTFCREPNSDSSGRDGNGPTNIFNSGAILRVNNANSDVCLIELDDPINSSAGAYFAGWDRSTQPAQNAVGVHHPGVSEKRISFDLDMLTSGSFFSVTRPNFWKVGQWEVGTTEPGSSGSPLFNPDGLIVGQLAGGEASCANFTGSDFYGKISESFSSSSSSSLSLRPWLDPGATGQQVLKGIEATVTAVASADYSADGNAVEVTIDLNSPSPINFELTVSHEEEEALSPASLTQAIPQGAEQVVFSFPLSAGVADSGGRVTFDLSVAGGSLPFGLRDAVRFERQQFREAPEVSAQTVEHRSGSPLSEELNASGGVTRWVLEGPDVPTGLRINSEGTLRWADPTPGNYTITLVVSNPLGEARAPLNLNIISDQRRRALDTEVPSLELLPSTSERWTERESSDFTGRTALSLTGRAISPLDELVLKVSGEDTLVFDARARLRSVPDEAIVGQLEFLTDTGKKQLFQLNQNFTTFEFSLPEGVQSLRIRAPRSQEAPSFSVDNFRLLRSEDVKPYFLTRPIVSAPAGRGLKVDIKPRLAEQLQMVARGANFGLQKNVLSTANLGSSATVTLRAENRFGRTEKEVRIDAFREDAQLRAALDANGGLLTTDSWSVSTRSRRGGSSIASSESLGDGGESSAQLRVLGPGRISFWWRVSSEQGFDGLLLLLNGSLQTSISGETGWARVDVDLQAGENLLDWTYTKDNSFSVGDDRGFVDDLSFTGFAGWQSQQPNLEGNVFTLDPSADLDGDGLSSVLEYATGLNPFTVERNPLVLSNTSSQLTIPVPANSAATGVKLYLESSDELLAGDWLSEEIDLGRGPRVRGFNLGARKRFFRLRAETAAQD